MPRNIFILDQGMQDAVIMNLKNRNLFTLFGVLYNEKLKRIKRRTTKMMRVFSMFLGIIMSILSFFSTFSSYTPRNEAYTDYEGVYITIEEIKTVNGEKVADVVWHNESDETVCYGLGYKVEFYNGESWEDVQIVDFPIPEIACILDGGQTATEVYRTQYFNMLRPGTYRIKTEFWIQDNFVLAEQTTYALFEVNY